MTKNINYVSHKKSKVKNNGKPQLPSANSLVEGEIAINYAKDVETLSIKNESGTVVTFSSDNYYTEKKLGSGFTESNSAVTVTDAIFKVEKAISDEASRATAAESALSSGKADKATTLAGYGITDAYTKSQTYTQTEVNRLVSTPHQNYVTVATYASLPATGSADTIYRVSNWDGSANSGAGAVDVTVYSEYAWNGSSYTFLCVKSQIGEVFDISVYNGNAKYDTLAEALGTNGEHVPQSIRRGGMSVKYVQNSDNNYVQYRCTSNSFTTDVTKWQSENVDNEPTIGSNSPVKSGGTFGLCHDIGVRNQRTESEDLAISDGEYYIVSIENGHIKTKRFFSGLSPEQVATLVNGEGDFVISDGQFAIAIFKDGQVKTKHFDSAHALMQELANVVNDNNDFVISDGQYAIIEFNNGHLKTKYFDSWNPKSNKCFFDYKFDNQIGTDFNQNENWAISSGKLVSTSAGVGKRLVNKKKVTCGEKLTYCRFKAYTDSYFAIGWISSAYSYDSSLISVDCSNSKFAIHEAWSNLSQVPSIKYEQSYNFINGRDYEIIIEKQEHTNKVWIRDCITGEKSTSISSEQTATSGLNEFSGGRQMDSICLVHISGTSPDIYYLKSVAKYITPLVVCYGDSITEGDRVYNGQTYVDLLKEELGEENVICSGLSGSNISSVITRINDELAILRPKIVMVTIGTNGGNSQALFEQLKNVIIANGAIPVVNVPPMFSGIDTVRGYVLSLGIPSARFDIATALNNDVSQGQNTSLFADGVHPNAQGHLAMFKRLMADITELFNY